MWYHFIKNLKRKTKKNKIREFLFSEKNEISVKSNYLITKIGENFLKSYNIDNKNLFEIILRKNSKFKNIAIFLFF